MANKARGLQWRKIPVSLTELCLDTTLRCGQSFRWRKSEDDTWSCALHGRIISLRQDATHLHYKAVFPGDAQALLTPSSSASKSTVASSPEDDDTDALVHHYLNLSPNLTELYEQWSRADANFRKRAPKFTGVRILRQDAWEALIGFICSSNNNIIRISQMMEKLCLHYGPEVGHIGTRTFHDMPAPSALTAPGVEAHLRLLGFGYRAKYLHRTAVMVADEHDVGWLDSLRNPESPILGAKPSDAGEMLPGGREGYHRAHEELLALQGVGPKVADCVCLMGLGWGEAIPVDTHVWQIAQRDYKFGKGKHSSLTKATYDAVGDKFRGLWGKEAGWAHSVLFTADLRAFSERLTAKTEVKEIKEEEDAKVLTEIQVRSENLTTVNLKRELEDEKKPSIAVEEFTAITHKRRRKA
ncbi:8-oxoguanine glycosylase ogg1 [Imshaugia aleurites]|uniref:DNA-(apurinic or apyrimidinic site) lyase n=1 Tax=Imshaugia aleurites TaxID=172621 RepID=A0A8H3IC70_9LECA|nr:8-oxoguanine glycosylase ogg1 [Imshaugia aleurites]